MRRSASKALRGHIHNLPLRNLSLRRAVPILALAWVVVTGAALARVWSHQRTIAYGYKISQASQLRSKLVEQNQRYRIELALLKSPKRLQQIAVVQLGLDSPDPRQLRRLPSTQQTVTQQTVALSPRAPVREQRETLLAAGFAVAR